MEHSARKEVDESQEIKTKLKTVNRISLWAIIISIIAISFCLTLGYKIVATPVSINDDQLTRIIEAMTASHQKEVKIDTLQMAQILSALEYGKKAKPMVRKRFIKPSGEIENHELINRYFEENQ